MLSMPLALIGKAHDKGLRESLSLARDLVGARIARHSPSEKTAFVFLSPTINHTGAPQILMQVVEEFAGRYGSSSIRLLSPLIISEMHERAQSAGVKVERAAAVLGPSLVRMQLALRQDDFVLMNTVAVLDNYRAVVLDTLRTGKLRHAYWYIHEDIAQLPMVAPSVLQSSFQALVGQLVQQDRLTLLVPSRKVKSQYDQMFGTTKTKLLPFKVDIDREYVGERAVEDYRSVTFLLSGRPTDGRKGHMIAIAAFHEFMKSYYELDPELYRGFTLKLVGMTKDYIATQIESVGSTVLGERFESVKDIPHADALDITRRCNAVICCSFNEALPLYVIEGMSMGHIVLRNDAGGLEEQLEEGVNGFRIDSGDVRQFARVLETVLNKTTMPDARLHEMGRASQEMIGRLRIPSYVDALGLPR